MVAIAVVTLFVAILAGMGISVCAFGTGGKRPKVFEDIYFSVEDVNGMGIVYTKGGDYSAVLKIKNPIRKYSASKASYYEFTDLFTSLLQLLGEGYALHKQDVFVRKQFDMNKIAAHEDKTAAKRFLSDSYFRFFNGRTYVAHETYLIITQKGKSGTIHSYDTAKWKDFLVKLQKVHDRLNGCDVESSFLGAEDCRIFADRFFAMDFKHSRVSMSNFRVTGEEIGMGNNHLKVYSLLDVDQVGLPGVIRPYSENQVGNSILSEDLLSALDSLPDVDTLVYNQVIFLPNQKKEVMKLDKKKNRHASIPNPNNQIAVEDIEKVQSEIARNGKMLVYAHYNMVIKIAGDKDFQKITNSLENMFSRHSIHISKRAYNQLELFVASFPGNCFKLNEDYDRFLTLSEPALCLMYKEHQQQGDNSPLKCYYTDRQGLPLPIDITGKEGKVKYTNNSNFFVLGPSGSGKSFFMNSVMRQYYEQDTDVVIVDTGDSYEGICNYFEGTYISYSKEKPISMNPFKITELEYEENFGEKKNFLKSLVFQLFKGTDYPTKIEDTIINQTITEYYEAYFHPFEKFSTKERSQLKEMLLLEDKKNGKYDQYEQEMEERYDRIMEEKESYKHWAKGLPFFIIGVVLVVAVTLANGAGGGASMDLSALSLGLAVKLVLVGMVAISAMFLPGISGSTMLLIFGAYMPVMSSLRKIMGGEMAYLPGILVFICGIILGALLVVKLIRTCLEKFRPQTVYMILGMMIGSFYSIVMGPTTLENAQPAMTFGAFNWLAAILGVALVLLLQFIRNKTEKVEDK